MAQMMISVFDRVDNIVGIEENAGYQNFLLSPQYFKSLLFQGRENSELCGKALNSFLALTSYILILMHQQQTAFENIVGKKEIAHNNHFLLLPQCILLNQKI